MTAGLASPEIPVAEQSSSLRAGIPKHVAKDLASGTSALGIALMVERGFGFLANVLAARLGGTGTYGAYSLAITTANNVSTYAAGGIGSTAIRFSGQYSRGSAGYPTLSRVLLIVSFVSALLAALALTAGASPIAHLLQKPELTRLLQWTGLSAAGMILLECCRGFLVGQRRMAAILLLSLTVGIGLVTLLPFAARLGAIPMICMQGGIGLGAVGLCLSLYRPLGLASTGDSAIREPLAPMLRQVWSFGFIQLAGLIANNAAGWWLASLVARADSSMAQMGFFAIASQLRNMTSLFPGLLSESSLAVMAQDGGGAERTPDQVMAVCTFATVTASLLLAGIGMMLVPWGLVLIYGKSYAAASSAVAVALAVAVVHMGSAPASARLSIISIRTTGLINSVWAVVVGVSASLFLFHQGSALKGMIIFLAGHLVSAVLVFAYLSSQNCVRRGVAGVFSIGSAVSMTMALLAVVRNQQSQLAFAATGAMIAVFCIGFFALFQIGKRHGWMPSPHTLQAFFRSRNV